MNSPTKRRVQVRGGPVRFWVFSLLLHFILLLALIAPWRLPKSESQGTPIEITIHETMTGGPAGAPDGMSTASTQIPASGERRAREKTKRRKSRAAEVVARLHLIDLMPGAPAKHPADNASDQGDNEASDNGDGGSAAQTLLGGGQQRQLALYNYIYRILGSHVIFPEELRTRGIHGNVTATVIFSPDGEYMRAASTFSSDNNYIKVLVLKTLREAFRENLNANFLKEHKRIEIHCHFEYAITEHDDALLEAKRNYVAGNNLKFYRHFQSSVLAWSLGPLHGWAVFPSVDVGWFAGLVSKKHEFDPLTFYRDDPEW